jgi:hypothetical protein
MEVSMPRPSKLVHQPMGLWSRLRWNLMETAGSGGVTGNELPDDAPAEADADADALPDDAADTPADPWNVAAMSVSYRL